MWLPGNALDNPGIMAVCECGWRLAFNSPVTVEYVDQETGNHLEEMRLV
jgi:hypothetical protein